MKSLTTCDAWKTLNQLANELEGQHMRDWFTADPNRAKHYTKSACGIELDFSKNIIDKNVLSALKSLAEERQVTHQRDGMFKGDLINTTEGRAVLHTALRNFSDNSIVVDGKDIMPDIRQTLAKMKRFTDALLSGKTLGYTGKPITQVIAIGIGGSFLGPKILSEALKPYHTGKLNVHFVANVDGCHIRDVLRSLDHERTIILMSSKSFTTQETLQNTISARDWFFAEGGSPGDVAKHFMCVSSNVKAAVEFGISEDNIFPMWDWVGGRYSLWSAIGLPIALCIGFDAFEAILKGAYEMDKHFAEAPFEDNLPMLMAMLGIWYRNFFGAQSHVLLPYYHYLRGLPAYVQQLDMESNGKQVAQSGASVSCPTGPIIWGSEGTNGQHSFHQLIHQSTTLIPADFILPLTVADKSEQASLHHAMLASNCFGQAQALMQGKSYDECLNDLSSSSLSQTERQRIASHKTMPGNKPSNTITFNTLDPKTLGALIALYEHKVFVQGAVWGLNSFDQWGVELGKVLGNQVLDGILGNRSISEFDSSTAQLIAAFQQAQQ